MHLSKYGNSVCSSWGKWSVFTQPEILKFWFHTCTAVRDTGSTHWQFCQHRGSSCSYQNSNKLNNVRAVRSL